MTADTCAGCGHDKGRHRGGERACWGHIDYARLCSCTAYVAQPVLADEVLYEAWTLLANVSEGDWTKQAGEWQEAVVRWRDRFHAILDLRRTTAYVAQPAPTAIPFDPSDPERWTPPTAESIVHPMPWMSYVADEDRLAAPTTESVDVATLTEAAHAEVTRLCMEPHASWRMSTPANETRDSDLIISNALTALERALAAERSLREAAEGEVASWQESFHAAHRTAQMFEKEAKWLRAHLHLAGTARESERVLRERAEAEVERLAAAIDAIGAES